MKTEIKLVANIDAGDGDIKVMPHFDTMYTLWQLDVLRDWIWDLQALYNGKVDIWEKELEALQEKLEPVSDEELKALQKEFKENFKGNNASVQ